MEEEQVKTPWEVQGLDFSDWITMAEEDVLQSWLISLAEDDEWDMYSQIVDEMNFRANFYAE